MTPRSVPVPSIRDHAALARSLRVAHLLCAALPPSADGRYGENPNRMQHYYQFQVLIKPSPVNAQELYLGSLAAIGLDPNDHDVRFVEDDWESRRSAPGPWLGGLAQRYGGHAVYVLPAGGRHRGRPRARRDHYGLERIAMYAQGVNSVYDLVWSYLPDGTP